MQVYASIGTLYHKSKSNVTSMTQGTSTIGILDCIKLSRAKLSFGMPGPTNEKAAKADIQIYSVYSKGSSRANRDIFPRQVSATAILSDNGAFS